MMSLILPAYNPGPAVETTWHEVESFIARRSERWEAVFVLDGCTDGTPERLSRLARQCSRRMRLVSYSPNRGKGHALRTGFLAAKGQARIFTDIDLAYSFEDVLAVADALRAGANVVIASREHAASRVQLPPAMLANANRRRWQSRLFGAIARTLLPLSQRDTQAGLKGMTATVAELLLPQMTCEGFGFDCELLTACVRSGIAVEEVPVCVRYESETTTTGSRSALRMIWDLWKIRKAWRNKIVLSERLHSGACTETPHPLPTGKRPRHAKAV